MAKKDRSKKTCEKEYDRMFFDSEYQWCWWCGRDCMQKPKWWHGPWMVERAHIVNKPRKRDRRVAVLLCSMCHKRSHGMRFPECTDTFGPPTIEQMLAIKWAFDPLFYSNQTMQMCSVRRLPQPESPPPEVMKEYLTRRRYPDPVIHEDEDDED